MLPILSQPPADAHIAPCGLFCSECGAFRKKRCQGCQVAPGFSRCAIRKCCAERGLTTCAGCEDFRAPRDFRECRKVNNWIAKIFKLIFGGDRPKALALLRDEGPEAYLREKRGKM